MKAETRCGFNFLGAGHALIANPIMPGNQSIAAGLIPAQQPGSIDKKPAVIYLSHQREAMRYYGCKNIVGRPPQGGETVQATQQTSLPGYPTASKKNAVGATYMLDVFDDPAHTVEALILWRPSLAAGMEITGPAVIEEANSTTFVPPGDRAAIDPSGNIVITIAAAT